MLKRVKYLFLVGIILVPCDAFADIKVFLIPTVKYSDEITIGDISNLDGNPVEAERLEKITIPPHLYSGGYISTKDILSILSVNTKETIQVFGTAVKIDRTPEKNSMSKKKSISKGDPINIVIRRNGITIEMIGTSLVNAGVGDRVTVDINSKKRIRGKLTNDLEVEVDL